MLSSLSLAGVILATSVASAVVALLILSAVQARRDPRPKLADLPAGMEPAIFLFDDHELVDATPSALRLLGPGGGGERERLNAYLAQHFPDAATGLASLAATGQLDLPGSTDGTLHLRAEQLSGMVRITISDPSEGQGVIVDSLSHRAQEDELRQLRDIAAAAPVLCWRQRPDGRIDWGNAAYLAALSKRRGVPLHELGWPFEPMMEVPDASLGTTSLDTARRVAMPALDGRGQSWFEVVSRPVHGGVVHFATPVDAAVKAEASLREFIQTLGKTFAHLTVGLAIFDRQRQLALFNPALLDLTGLDAQFLIGRPTLFTVLDKLREMRMIPEPKDYRGWRQQMADLERAAAAGFHQETWTLPTGQTYRVTGRPHPDGAVAFLFEDISAEVSLTRRFRAEIEMGQEIADHIAEAIAVFSPAGVLLQANAAYTRLWGIDPGATLGAVTIRDSVRHWQAMTLASPLWSDVRDFVLTLGPRAGGDGKAALKDGRVLTCRFVAMSGGSTLVGFSATTEAAGPKRPLKVRRASLLQRADETEDA